MITGRLDVLDSNLREIPNLRFHSRFTKRFPSNAPTTTCHPAGFLPTPQTSDRPDSFRSIMKTSTHALFDCHSIVVISQMGLSLVERILSNKRSTERYRTLRAATRVNTRPPASLGCDACGSDHLFFSRESKHSQAVKPYRVLLRF